MNDHNRKQRIAMIGIGDIAQKVYLPLLAYHERVDVVGVMSRSRDTVSRTMQTYRIPQGTTDLDELLSWNVDAVFVHSPTDTHYDMVKACLERGLSVYVDKPLTENLVQSKELAALAASQGLLLAVGFNRRFAPMYREAKMWMEEAGGFDQVTASKHRTGKQQGSCRDTIYDDLIHVLDLLLWLSGNDYRLLQQHMVQDEGGRMLHASGVLGLRKDGIGGYSMIRQAGCDMEKLELHGNGRSVEIINLEHTVLYEKGKPPQSKAFGSWDTVLKRRGFSGAVDHFLENVQTPQKCTIRADLVMDSHELASNLADQ